MANYDDTTTVSGSVVSFDNGADEVGAKSCVVTLPASLDGYSSVDVVSAGKNFLDDTLANLEQGSINGSTGANENANNRVRSINAIPFPYDKIASSYSWTIPSGYKVAIRPYDKDGNFVQLPSWALAFITQLPTDLIGQGITQMKFVLAKADNSAITPSDMANVGFQIEVGSASTYEPYTAPTTHTANLGRTIYGGSVDVVKGEGTDENGNDFTFEPVTIETSKGSNTFWSEQGSTELTYYKDGYGFTSVTVNKTGKNLLPTQTIVTSGNTHYVGGADSYFFFKKGTYTESNLGAGAYMYWRKKDTTDNNIIHTHNSNSGTFTLDEDCEIRFWYYYVGTQDFTNIQIELGSSPSSYVPYETPTVKTAYLHKVIYGGEVDVIKGTAKPKNLFDVGTKKSDYSNTDQRLVSVENGVITMKIITAGSTYTYRLQNINYVGAVTISATGSVVYSRFFVRFRNADDTSWLSNNDVTISESGWTYNQYYQGWFCQNSKVNASKSITIPSCLYWQLGVGFSSTNVGNEETLSNIMIEKGSTASEYVPHFEPFSFTPISIETDEGENTLFANEGESSITYRKAVD